MATKQKGKKSTPVKKSNVQKPASARMPFPPALLAILVISFLAYLPVFHNGFVNWDDDKYIKNDPLIYSINLKNLFVQYVASNYHPLTMLTYALEFHLWGFNTAGYHAVSLLLHLLNVILVYYVVLHLSNKTVVALIAALLFGIHPLHVESVAWASELKDLLYTFFFLASYLCYLVYLERKKAGSGKMEDGSGAFTSIFHLPSSILYVFSVVLFLFSVLSKAMAVSLPALLLLTDYFMGRKMNAKVWLEKVPFVVIGIILGIVAVHAQKSTGAIQDLANFPFYQRLVYACYGFMTYLFKLVLPTQLCAYYPYPVRNGEAVPGIYYIYPVLLMAFLAFVFYTLRFSKKILFGIGFFAITVFLVLQLLPVGGTIMSDRYSYIPSIGIFYLAGEGFYRWWNNKSMRWMAATVLGIYTIFFSVKSYSQCEVWKNGMTLWNDILSQYQTIPPIYNNRGIDLMADKKYDEALSDFNKAIQLQPDYALAYNDRGIVMMDVNRFDEALSDFNNAIKYQPVFPQAYTNRGIVYSNQKRNDLALRDYNKALEQQPDYANTYYYRGFLYAGENKSAEAISDYNMVTILQPDNAEAFYNKAIVEYNSGKKEEGCSDLQQAINLGWQNAANAKRDLCH